MCRSPTSRPCSPASVAGCARAATSSRSWARADGPEPNATSAPTCSGTTRTPEPTSAGSKRHGWHRSGIATYRKGTAGTASSCPARRRAQTAMTEQPPGDRPAGEQPPGERPADEQSLGEHALRAARTYGAAADHYSRPALGFWDRFGAATVSRLEMAAGDSVLDLCCGAGASAIPAARAVGAAGRVLGIDLAGALLAQARDRARREGLANIEFRQGDATVTGLPGGRFDAVVCVFGVFFAPDMAAFVAEMWRLVQPGGVLAVTTWGPGLFEPANSCFWASGGEVEPSLFKAFNPWDEITTPEALTDLFLRAGVAHPAVVAAPGQHHLDRPDGFWDIVLGSGYRATVDALGQQGGQVRTRLLTELRSRCVTALRTDVVFGTARSPGRPG